MSSFMSAMDTSAEMYTFTDNGQLSFTQAGVGDDLLAFYFKLVRGATREYVDSQMKLLMDKPSTTPSATKNIEDLMVLMFQTRDVRGGKGERQLFYWMFISLYKNFDQRLMSPLLSMIPTYGSFKDLNMLWEMADTEGIKQLKKDIINLYTLHLKIDSEQQDDSKLTLVAKWAPRESGHFCEMARDIARNYYTNHRGSSKKIYTLYRKLISSINKRLNTVEIHMAGNTWSEINPSSVPSRCLMINRDAFQNKVHSGKNVGEQRSFEFDRIGCAQKFKEHLASGKEVHGGVLHPNDIIKRYNTSVIDTVLEAQWRNIVSEYTAIIHEKLAMGDTPRNMIPVIDVSGSMACGYNSTCAPIDAAVGLGILLSELSVGTYKNRAITFSAAPEWINLEECENLAQKISNAKNATWGMTTNLYRMFKLILKVAVKKKVSEEEIGNMDLIILSDMQFDASQEGKSKRGVWETTLQNIKDMYKRVGYNKIPHIIFWNLQGRTMDFPEQANTPNVTMVSGFSPSAAMTLLTEGKAAMEYSVKKEKKTPMDTFIEILEHETYQPVRALYRSYLDMQKCREYRV